MQAQTQPLEITDLCNELLVLLEGAQPDIGRLHQIEVRAERLMRATNSPRELCLCALFLVAYGLVERDKAEKLIEETARMEVITPQVLVNAARILMSIGSNNSARALIERMAAVYPDSKIVLQSAVSNLQTMLQFELATHLLLQYEKLILNETSFLHPRARASIVGAQAFAADHGLTVEGMSSRLQVAIEVVRSKGFEVLHQSRLSFSDGSFISQLFVNTDAPGCAELNFDIADALVDGFDDPGSSVFSISSRPTTDYPGGVIMEFK